MFRYLGHMMTLDGGTDSAGFKIRSAWHKFKQLN